MMRFLLSSMMLATLLAAEPGSLYPFHNAVRPLPAEEGVALLKELGYRGIGSVDPQELAKYQGICKKANLKVFSIYCSAKVHKNGFTHDGKIPAAIALLKGTDSIVELNVQRGEDPQEAHAVSLVKRVAADAKAAGLRVVIYPHYNDYIERVDHALQIAKASGCDNVGVAFNLCHFLKVQPNDDLSQTLTAAKDYLWSVSICGADRDGKDWNSLIRPLDQGTFDQASLLSILKKQGYQGSIGLQCFNIRIAPRQHLASSLAAWKLLHSDQSAPR